MSFTNRDRHDKSFWEERAETAIKHLLDVAELDEIRGVVLLPPHHDDGFHFDTECSSIEHLADHLREIYNQEWYSYVPFDGGSAVFEDNAWETVEDLLLSHQSFTKFFERHRSPLGSEQIMTAGELLEGAEASRQVRISLEEINDELVAYLATHPEKMRELNPRRFEELVAAMFRNQGYDVTLTPKGNDGGMDVIAVQRSGLGTAMLIVECKRYSETNKVGVEIVRGLYGVVEQRRATQGIIATTSYFTRGATTFRNDVEHRITLADFDVLTDELSNWRDRIRQ